MVTEEDGAAGKGSLGSLERDLHLERQILGGCPCKDPIGSGPDDPMSVFPNGELLWREPKGNFLLLARLEFNASESSQPKRFYPLDPLTRRNLKLDDFRPGATARVLHLQRNREHSVGGFRGGRVLHTGE